MKSRSAAPRVWVLTGPKSGDNSQSLALAEALHESYGWPFEVRPLSFRRSELLQHVWPRPTLAGLQSHARRSLGPPWPDLIITAGRRNELVARWIRRQAGKPVRLVHLGRPWSRLDHFDLVLTTPQYTLPPANNVLVQAQPLHRVDGRRLAAAGEAWREDFAGLPRPWTVLLVGGDSGPFVFTRALAARLASLVNRLVARSGGSLLLSTSARTPESFCERLVAALDVPRFVHRWRAGAQRNPYMAFLALGDRFIVTADSVSMTTEALATEKPVWLFAVDSLRRWWLEPANFRWKPLTHRLAMTVAPARFRRDVNRMHEQLVASGRVRWLADTAQDFEPAAAADSTAARQAVEPVRALFGPFS